MKKLFLSLCLLGLTFSSFAATTVMFYLPEFGANPVTNRQVTIQPTTPFVGNVIFLPVTDSSGYTWYSNAAVGTYNGTIKAPPGAINFQFVVTSTNLGVIDALTNTTVSGVQTVPAGASAWSITSSDARYARNLSNFNTATLAGSAGVNVVNGGGAVLGSGTTIVITNLPESAVSGLNSSLAYLTNAISSGGEATNIVQVEAGPGTTIVSNNLLRTIIVTNVTGSFTGYVFAAANMDMDGWIITNLFGLRPQEGQTIEIVNAVVDGSFTGDLAGATNLPIQSAVRYISKVRPSNNDTNWFGAWTPGTVTEGFQEALDSLPRGTETGPTTAGGAIVFTDGIFFFTNNIYYSNNLTYAISLRAENELKTKVVYAGTQSGTNLIWFRGGPHTVDGGPASLNLPTHIWVKGLTLSSINPNTNVLLCITNDSWWKVENVNFTGWQATTNQDWGSAMSLNGLTYYTNDTGLVGLVAGNVNDHSGTVRDCSFAGLALGGVFHTDHLVMQGFKTAMVGVDGNGRYNNLWPTNHPYALGFGFLRYPRLDSHYEDGHFYGTAGGFGYMNFDGGTLPGDVQYLQNIVFENDPPHIAAIVTNKVIWVYNGVYEVNGAIPFAASSQYRINTNDYKHPVQAPLILNGVVYNNPAYLVAPFADGGFNLRSGVFSGNGLGLTNTPGIVTNSGSGVNNTLSNLTVSLSGPDKTLTWKLPGNLNDTGTKILWQNTNTISVLELNSLSDGEFKTWLHFDVNDTASGMFLWKPYGDGGLLTGDDEAYGPGWDGDVTFPTKNAVYDKIETISGGSGDGRGWDTNGNSGLSAANFVGTVDNLSLQLRSSNTTLIKIDGYSNTITLGKDNTISGWQPHSTIGGGRGNLINGRTNSAFHYALGFNVIGGGATNSINESGSFLTGRSFIGGGYFNSINDGGANALVLVGGGNNTNNGPYSFLGGGNFNYIQAQNTYSNGNNASLIGGANNTASGDYSVAAGRSNTVTGIHGVVPGGLLNSAPGSNSFAAGFRAKSQNTGSFVWSDSSSESTFTSAADNEFAVRAAGGLRLSSGSFTGNGAGITNLGGVKFWRGLVSQSTTSDPTATTDAANTLGTITWARSSPGVYTATISPAAAFTANKTYVTVGSTKADGSATGWASPVTIDIRTIKTSTSVITFETVATSLNEPAAGYADSLLSGTEVEIRVLP